MRNAISVSEYGIHRATFWYSLWNIHVLWAAYASLECRMLFGRWWRRFDLVSDKRRIVGEIVNIIKHSAGFRDTWRYLWSSTCSATQWTNQDFAFGEPNDWHNDSMWNNAIPIAFIRIYVFQTKRATSWNDLLDKIEKAGNANVSIFMQTCTREQIYYTNDMKLGMILILQRMRDYGAVVTINHRRVEVTAEL